MSSAAIEPNRGMMEGIRVSKQPSLLHHALLARAHGDMSAAWRSTLREPGIPPHDPNRKAGAHHSVIVRGFHKDTAGKQFRRALLFSQKNYEKTGPRPSVLLSGVLAIILPSLVFAQDAALFKTTFSGYLKSLNFFTETTGLQPEMFYRPTAYSREDEDVFSAIQRIRLKIRSRLRIDEGKRLTAKIDYDHESNFGEFLDTGDSAIARSQRENRQFIDLSQSLAEGHRGRYEHRLYRASISYESDRWSLEIGRQQISWGVGHFFTPTDIFNPFNPTQIELEERDGVDALNFKTHFKGTRLQFVYTPRGRVLHPQRWFTRASHDLNGTCEVGLLGGWIHRDFTAGFDFAGNMKGSAVRGELLFRAPDGDEKEFVKFMVNADYNFPHNVYALLEYYFNGQGRRDHKAYQLDQAIRGDIQQLGKNYLALMLGYDITELLRLEYRTIFNMDDASLFLRPELQYELKENLLITLGAQIFLGENLDEYGRPKNLFLGEMMYSF